MIYIYSHLFIYFWITENKLTNIFVKIYIRYLNLLNYHNNMKVVYLILFISIVSADNFTLFKSKDESARCLDGSASALYYQSGVQSDKFLIYF